MSDESGTTTPADAQTEFGGPAAAEPASPCISVCALDENDVCLGCYRTSEEITDWFMASAAKKREILARAAARRADANPVRLL
jgi:predicted Fe-S protein YdhL (DUF1289 family)